MLLYSTPYKSDIGSGLGVVLWHKELKLKSGYWHFLENKVKLNDEVVAGQLLGLADSTGMSYGNHVHVFVKETDQLGNTINKDNGFGGAIPFRQYLSWFDSIMDETLVKARQVVEGYLDPEGQQYWKTKPEKEYWIARIQDKIKQLQETLTELQNT